MGVREGGGDVKVEGQSKDRRDDKKGMEERPL